MLSLASLLNPAPSGPLPPTPRYRQSPALSSPAPSLTSECHNLFFDRHITPSKQSKMMKDSGGFVKAKAKGIVNFPPFESLDDHSLREIRRYQIYPWGKIQEYCRHIPYNSGKKNFYDKTGRESFEVFQYIFKVPGDETEYTVMWDYNVGLVRMTPFFKCCKYSKTQPAKMLNLNPGLRDITHSITGGSIAAQGYWMPFNCAKAVCVTFCASIAGALIPIFGPDFPSLCISPDAPDHGRMQIDPMLIMDSARQAEMFRRLYANAASVAANSHLPPHHHQQHHNQDLQSQMHHYSHGPALPSPTSIPSPRLARRALPRYDDSPQDYDRERLGFEGRMRFKHGPEHPYTMAFEPEAHAVPKLQHALASHTLARGGMPYSPVSPPRSSGNGAGWTVSNHSAQHPEQAHTPSRASGAYHYSNAYQETHDFPYSSASDPILSAIPRSSHGNQRLDHQHHQNSQHVSHLYSQAQPQQQQQLSHFPHRLPLPPSPSTWDAPHENINVRNSSKRAAADILQPVSGEVDDYSDESSPMTTVTASTSTAREDSGPEPSAVVATLGTDKTAALLLMNLSVRDHRHDGPGGKEKVRESSHRFHGTRGCGPESMSMSPVCGSDGGQDGHRSKRRRATSM